MNKLRNAISLHTCDYSRFTSSQIIWYNFELCQIAGKCSVLCLWFTKMYEELREQKN